MTKKSLTPNQLFSILNKAAIEVQQLPPNTELYLNYDEGGYTDGAMLITSLQIVVSYDKENNFAEVKIGYNIPKTFSIDSVIFKHNLITEEGQLEAIKKDSLAFRLIKNPSKKVQMEAFKRDSWNVRYISDPDILLECFKLNFWAIVEIKNPEVQLEAVKYNIWAIDHIDNPTEAIQLEVIKQDELSIQHIKNPTDKVKQLHKDLWES